MNKWRFLLLDREDNPLGELDGVTGGGGEIVAQSPLGGSASLSLDKQQDIDWMRHRVQAVYQTSDDEWPVGTYLLTSPTEKHSQFGTTFDVGLLTKMNVIQEDAVEDRYTLKAGTPIIPAVEALIRSTGETRIAVTPSDVVLASDVTWEPATSKREIANDLLTAAGYWSLWCDGSGQFRVEPYVDPSARPIAYAFEHGEASVHFPDWEREQDHSSVPNKFIAVGQGDDEAPPLVGVATNEDPDSPYSYQSRGRWIVEQDDGVEAATQDVIDQYAARKLRDAMSPVSRLKVDHAMLDLNQNDLVSFLPEDGVTRLATVQRMAFNFEPFTDIRAEWRQA